MNSKVGTGVIEKTKLDIPEVALVFKHSNTDRDLMCKILLYFCEYSPRKALAKALEIQTKGEAIVLSSTRSVVEDIYSLIADFCQCKSIMLQMEIREEK